MSLMTKEETIRQSQDAYRQWKDTWHKNAERNGKVCGDARDIMSTGRNRCAVACATGQSLENHIETMKKYQDKPGVDIICVDKSFGLLIERGIKPKYVAVSDAQVSFDTWTEKYIEKTKDVTLIVTATANPVWAERWLGPKYIVICKDAIGTENIIKKISGASVILPASSNVGNGLIVAAIEILCYSMILLIGYDFSWKPDKNYYAFSGDADGIMVDKRQWQKAGCRLGIDDKLTFESSNLTFAMRWLQSYYLGKIAPLPIDIYNCSGQGILDCMPKGNLDRCLELFNYLEPSQSVADQIIASRVRTVRCKTQEEFQEVVAENQVFYIDVMCVPKAAESLCIH